MALDKDALAQLRIERTSTAARKPWLLAVVLVLLAVLAGGAWWLWQSRPVGVRTVAARAIGGAAERTVLNASGYVTARRQATVSSKVTGKVIEVLVEEGRPVEAEQVLARLDASNVDASLKLAEARQTAARSALEETKVRLDEAERTLRRTQALSTGNIVSESELERAEADVNSWQARLTRQQDEVAVAAREVGLWKQQFEDTIIRAPFAGMVISKNAQPGEMISPVSAGGGFTRTGICTIVDMQSLEIEVDVNESYLQRLQPDQPVLATLDAYPDWQIPARLIAIVPTADRQKATVRVRVGFEKLDPRLLPDMGVKVAFQSEENSGTPEAGVVIPKAAIRQQGGRKVVLVVQAGQVAERAVTLGTPRQEDVTVLAGLSAGDRVVVEGPDKLSPGNRVVERQP